MDNSNNLLHSVKDQGLWLSSNNITQYTPRTIAQDLDKLPAPRRKVVGQGLAPPLPPTPRDDNARLNSRRVLAKSFVQQLITGVVEHHGESILDHLSEMHKSQAKRPASVALSGDASNTTHHGRNSTIYMLRTIIPVLIPGLEELMRNSLHVAESRRLGSGRRPILPTDWLGMYLMRNNPKHKDQRTVPKDAFNSAELTELTNKVIAEMITAKKAKQRVDLWKNRNKDKTKKLWENICPAGESELSIGNIHNALSELSSVLGFGDRLMDATELFEMMDVDGDGRISISEFEDAIGEYLAHAEDAIEGFKQVSGGRLLARGWAYKAATKKLQTRLLNNKIDAAALFETYKTKDDSETIGLVGIIKSVKEIEGSLDANGYKPDEIELSEDMQKLPRNSCLSFEEFSRVIANEIDLVAKRIDERAQQRAREMARKRAEDDRKATELIMKRFENIETVSASAEKILEQSKRDLDNARMLYNGMPLVRVFPGLSDAETAESNFRVVLNKKMDEMAAMSRKELASVSGDIESCDKIVERATVRKNNVFNQMSSIRDRLRSCDMVDKSQIVEVDQEVYTFQALAKTCQEKSGVCHNTSAELLKTMKQRNELFNAMDRFVDKFTALKENFQNLNEVAESVGRKDSIQEVQQMIHDSITSIVSALDNEVDFSNIENMGNIIDLAKERFGGLEAISNQVSDLHNELKVLPKIQINDRKAEELESVLQVENNEHEQNKKSRKKVVRKIKKKRKETQIKKGEISTAAKTCKLNVLEKLLSQGANPNEKDKNGSTPLVHLSWPGNFEGARILLMYGGSPLVANLRCNTAMHFAFERGHIELIKLFICNGGKEALHMKNSLGKTPGALNPELCYLETWEPTEEDQRTYEVENVEFH